MRVVYCIAGTYRGGGMERVLALKANWLARHGYEVWVLTTDQRGREPFFAFDESVRMEDLDVGYEDNNGAGFVSKLIHYPLKQWRHRRRMAAALNRIDPDVVVSMFCNEAGFASKLHRRSRKVLEIHFSRFKRLQYGRSGLMGLADRLRSRMDVNTARRYDRFVVLTNEDRGYWGDMENITVIGNPMTFKSEKVSELKAKTALAIGRFTHQKSFDRLIEAWSKVAERHPDWKLRIVGDGALRPQMESRIARLGLTECIELMDPTKDVESLYADASMYLMTSRYEGLPMVLIEAQSCGLPIVSFTCKCGPRDVVTDGEDGFLVEDGATEVFADRVCQLIENPGLRKDMGQKASEASKRYNIDRIMSKWVGLFNELTDER